MTTDPSMLTDADRAWAKALCDAMITSSLSFLHADQVADAADLYAAVRTQALEVRTDDLLGAERWFIAMFYLASRNAGFITQIATQMGRDPLELWSDVAMKTRHGS